MVKINLFLLLLIVNFYNWTKCMSNDVKMGTFTVANQKINDSQGWISSLMQVIPKRAPSIDSTYHYNKGGILVKSDATCYYNPFCQLNPKSKARIALGLATTIACLKIAKDYLSTETEYNLHGHSTQNLQKLAPANWKQLLRIFNRSLRKDQRKLKAGHVGVLFEISRKSNPTKHKFILDKQVMVDSIKLDLILENKIESIKILNQNLIQLREQLFNSLDANQNKLLNILVCKYNSAKKRAL